MTMKCVLKRAALSLAAVLLLCTPVAMGGFAVLPDWRHGKGDLATVAVDELVYDGARAQVMRMNIRARNGEAEAKRSESITQNLVVDLTQARQLTFKARFTATGSENPSVDLLLKGKNISVRKAISPATAVGQAKEGFYEYKLDLPANTKGDQRLLQTITLTPDFSKLAAGSTVKVEFIDMIFDEGVLPGVRDRQTIASRQWVTEKNVSYRDLPVVGWRVEKEEAAQNISIETTAVKVQGKDQPALKIRYRPSKVASAVILPIKADVTKENVLTFMGSVQAPRDSKQLGTVEAPMTGWFSYQFNEFLDNFGVGFEDPNGFGWASAGVPTTHFLQHVNVKEQPVDGLRRFTWDILHENPTGNKGFDRQNVTRMVIFYDSRKLKEGQETVITIVNPQLATGMMRTGGDMDRYAQFKKEMSQYKADYSDSSHYLEPPVEGRLETPLPLIRDGKAVGEIVSKPSVWNPAGNAAIEFHQWLLKLTGGVHVPFVDKPTDADNTKIFIGAEYARQLFPEDIEALKDSDGIAIRTRGKHVYIFGARPKGTLNAMYTFLEANTDIIFPHPAEVFQAVHSQYRDLDVRWGNHLYRPPARYWGWMGEVTGPQLMYQIRNRANYVGIRSGENFKYWGLYREEGGGHNLHSWIPFSLFKTNPEYWALIDGKRQHPNGYKNQICLSNPDGRQIFMTRMRTAIDRKPVAREANCFNIKIEDNWGVCECEECTRPIRLPDGTILPPEDIAFRSTQFFMFLNSVANHLHNTGLPKMQIGTYVYFYTVPVPKVPVTSYLRPYFAPYVRKDMKVPLYAPINDIWWRIVNEWAAINPNVVMREYTGLYVNLRPLADVAAYDIRALLEAGVREFTSERIIGGIYESPEVQKRDWVGIDIAAAEFWIISRLYWNPNEDVQQLRRYFLRRTFREASPAMEKFYGLAHELYYAEQRTSDYEENHETLKRAIVLGKDHLFRQYLDEALQTAKHPVSQMWIRLISDKFDNWHVEAARQLKAEQEKASR